MHLSDASSRQPCGTGIESRKFCQWLVDRALQIISLDCLIVPVRFVVRSLPGTTVLNGQVALWNRRATVQNSRLQAGTVRC